MGLRFVGAVERRDSLQFENDLVVNHDVSLIVAHVQALVGDGQFLLWLERNAAQGQFVRQCLLVDGFQKTGADTSVYLISLQSFWRQVFALRPADPPDGVDPDLAKIAILP